MGAKPSAEQQRAVAQKKQTSNSTSPSFTQSVSTTISSILKPKKQVPFTFREPVIILESTVFPRSETPQDFESPLNFDCWVEICRFFRLSARNILNLALSHKYVGSLLYNENFWQRLCFPAAKERAEISWKEQYSYGMGKLCRFDPQLLKLQKEELQKLELRGLVYWIATHHNGVQHEYQNPCKTGKIAISSSSGDWYSITLSSLEQKNLLYIGIDRIKFPWSTNTGYTLCSGNTQSLIYDFGPDKEFVSTHLVWFCDYDPNSWFAKDSIFVMAYDEKEAIWRRFDRKVIPTHNPCVHVIQTTRQPFRMLMLANSGTQTLISGLEIFGRLRKRGADTTFKFSSNVGFFENENLDTGYINKKPSDNILYENYQNDPYWKKAISALPTTTRQFKTESDKTLPPDESLEIDDFINM